MSNKTMKNKDIIVSQAEQIVKLNNQIDRLKKQIYDLKKCFVDDMKSVNEAMEELDVKFQNGELTSDKHAEIQKKVSLRMNPYRYCLDKIMIDHKKNNGSFLEEEARGK